MVSKADKPLRRITIPPRGRKADRSETNGINRKNMSIKNNSPYKGNYIEKFEKQKILHTIYPQVVEWMSAARSYREWLDAKGYNTRCEHFNVSKMGDISCTNGKPLILCGGRCINKSNK